MTTQPVAPPPAPPVPDPTPPPIPAGQKWYQSSAFIAWILTTLVSAAFGIAVLIGHPFDSTLITALIPSVSFAVAGLTTAIFVHGQNQLSKLKLEHAQNLEYIHYAAKLEQSGSR